jgi:hypothetical protein
MSLLSKRKISELLASALDAPAADPFVPSDRALAQRLATFRASTWFGKPAALCAPVCAMHGWTNSAFDTLACTRCGAVLVVPNDGDEALWRSKLTAAHKTGCLWRVRALSADAYRFPDLGPSAAVRWLRHRCEQLGGPWVRCDAACLVRAPRPAACLTAQPPETLDMYMEVTQKDADTTLLAAFGWRPAPRGEGDKGRARVLLCELCTRRVPAKLYKAPNEDDAAEDAREAFDPRAEHYPFCPWIARYPLAGQPDEGWRLALAAVRAAMREQAPRARGGGVGTSVADTVSYVRALLEGNPPKKTCQ